MARRSNESAPGYSLHPDRVSNPLHAAGLLSLSPSLSGGIMRQAIASLLLICTAIAPNAWASPCGRGYPPGMECENLADIAVNSVRLLGAMAAAKRNLSIEIEQARRRYFATYPNGPGHAQAEKEYL